MGAESIDSFNLPRYFASAEEVRESIEAPSNFEIRGPEACGRMCFMHEEDFQDWVYDARSFGKRKLNLVGRFVGILKINKFTTIKC